MCRAGYKRYPTYSLYFQNNVSSFILQFCFDVYSYSDIKDSCNNYYNYSTKQQTLEWPEASPGSTIFKVTATNSCGGQATACFIVNYCETCMSIVISCMYESRMHDTHDVILFPKHLQLCVIARVNNRELLLIVASFSLH